MFRSALFVILPAFTLLTALAAESQASTDLPNFPDVTIKTRITRGLTMPTVHTFWLKGARQRTESYADRLRHTDPATVRITQCDQQAQITLFQRSKTYRSAPWHVIALRRATSTTGTSGRVYGPSSGPQVTITFDSVDTSERRAVGSFEARHVITTTKVKPRKGAVTKRGKTKIDGWYIDLPGFECRNNSAGQLTSYPAGWHVPMQSGGRDHIVFKFEGDAPLGYAIEETFKEKMAGNVVVNKVELIDISDQPLDKSLFEVPADYKPVPASQPGVMGVPPVSPTSLPE